MPDRRLVVGITGASGAPYAIRFLEEAIKHYSEVYVAFSETAPLVIQHETGRELDPEHITVEALLGRPCPAIHILERKDFFSSPSSGSFRHGGMVIIPCSMGTAGRIASGISEDIITRAADVCLKEKSRLILVPREAPWSLIHLRNLATLAEAGATILPACPGFYNRPTTVDDLLNHIVGRVLQQLGVEQRLIPEWQHP